MSSWKAKRYVCICVLCVFPQIPYSCSHLFTQVCLNVCSSVLFVMQGPHIFPVEMLETLMVFLWHVGEVLGRCLSEGHIACGVSQDTCPMIMFMKIITGLGSCRVPSLENSRGLNFKLYCYPWKRTGRSGCHVQERSVQLARCLCILTVNCKSRCSLLFSSFLFSCI